RVERAGERGAEQAASGDVHVEGSGLKSEDVAAFAMPVVGEWARVCAGRRVARRDACDPPRRRRAARPRVAGGVSRWARARWPRRRARRADVGARTVTGARGESRAASPLHRPHHPSTQPSGRRAFRDGLRVRECWARGAGAYVTG
ncbi:hypothetical protein OGH71_19275, partial [Burkholderia pseudomallei]